MVTAPGRGAAPVEHWKGWRWSMARSKGRKRSSPTQSGIRATGSSSSPHRQTVAPRAAARVTVARKSRTAFSASAPVVRAIERPTLSKPVGLIAPKRSALSLPSFRKGSPLGKDDGGAKRRVGRTQAKKTPGDAERRGRSPQERPAQQHAKKSPELAQSSKRRDWSEVCKERPDSRKARKGGGGSKEFVPWCDRK